MKRLGTLVFVVMLSVSSLAWAQPGGGRGGFGGGPGGGTGLLGLAQMEAVQKEIEAVEDQVAAIRKLAEDTRAARPEGQRPDFRNMDEAAREKAMAEARAQREKETAATNAKLAEILLPPQIERLEQISLQMRGTAALADAAVAAKLSLTADQKQKLEAAMTANQEAMRQAFQGGGRDQDREQMRTRFQELRKNADEKVLAVLTTAPVDGVIVRDSVEQGGFVQRGTVLFCIEDMSSIEVQCSLKMSDLYWLWRQRPGSAASPETDEAAAYRVPQTAATVIYQFAGRDDLRFSWQGMLTRFEGSGLDERTRTAPCRVVVPQPREVAFAGPADRQPFAAGPPALVRGMFVTVLLHVCLEAPLVQVPDEALQPGKYVWRVRDGRLARLGPLALVQRLEEPDAHGQPHRFWVTPALEADLSTSDRLVIAPVEGMADGARVEVPIATASDAEEGPPELGGVPPSVAAPASSRESLP